MTTSLTRIEPLYVVDTNALIWYLSANPRLSKIAESIFKAAEQGQTRLYISAIVIAELYYANKKWNIFPDFAKTYNHVKAQPYFELVPLLADDMLEFDQDSAIPEMHDRIIAGLARKLGAPLITSDSLIAASGVAKIVW